MGMYQNTDILNIEDVAARLNCSTSTVRRMLSKKLIPQAIKRRGNRECLRWRRCDIDSFFDTPKATKAPQTEGSIEQLVRKMIQQELRAFMQEVRTIN